MVHPKRLHGALRQYASDHQNEVNRWVHLICVPVLLWGALALLARIKLSPYVDLAMAVAMVHCVVFWFMDWKLGFPYFVFVLGVYGLARDTSVAMALWISAAGWVLQIFGHFHFEKNKPSFFSQITQLFIGPIWWFAHVIEYPLESEE